MPDLLETKKIDLKKMLTVEQLALLHKVAEAATEQGTALYLVGGFVRDLLLGHPAKDFDLVVEGDAIGFVKKLAARYGGSVTGHSRFGTAQWFRQDSTEHALDFISTRSETYKQSGELPMVKPGNLIDDLKRRDFSINTLAIRLDGRHWGELRDELGGLRDLGEGSLRILHNRSFKDDPTRIFRLVRYEQRYGFHADTETMELILEARNLVSKLSAERLRNELDLILEEEQASAMLKRLANLELLAAIDVTLRWNQSTQVRFARATKRLIECSSEGKPSEVTKSFYGWHFWLMNLDNASLENLENRLHFHANLFHSLQGAVTLWSNLLELEEKEKPSQIVKKLDEYPLTSVQSVFFAVSKRPIRSKLRKYLVEWRSIKPNTNGHTLIKRGVKSGPQYQRILSQLRSAWLDGAIQSNDQEKEFLEELLSNSE